MRDALLLQLPLNQPAALSPTGNVPLAAGCLLAAAGLGPECLLPQDAADTLGDASLFEHIRALRPSVLGLTLYSWNIERSLHLAGRLRSAMDGLTIIAGGPEVFPDNPLLEGSPVDMAVCGEGEAVFPDMLRDLEGPTARRGDPGPRLVVAPATGAAPGRYPNPYLTGHITIGPGDAAYVETQRGCAGGCIYCSYRRSSPVPRLLSAADAVSMLSGICSLDPGEIVFLDPCFNARPDLSRLLRGLRRFHLPCFAELRGEGVGAEQAAELAAAGFTCVEVGLQTMSAKALERAGRSADPDAVIRGCLELGKAGVRPVVDIIIGLPGDTPDGILETAGRLVSEGLSEDVQVFTLSVLPGTELRASASTLGIEYEPLPPYHVSSLPGWSPSDLEGAREELAAILGYDLDMPNRPVLTDGWPGEQRIDLDAGGAGLDSAPPPSVRHGSLLVSGSDLWAHRDDIAECIRSRRGRDPYCVLDVVLRPGSPFPLDLLDRIRALDEPLDYSGRLARLHGRDGLVRPAILLARETLSGFPEDWVSEVASCCQVVVDVPLWDPDAASLLSEGLGVRLPGSDMDLSALARAVPECPELLFFRSGTLEKIWVEAVLEA
ncbi:radical SAM protein [Candidatus Fermentibacterales bacterium]|nr:radical SAM protein [Candidatus Fermentibacterales bacterium]